MNAILEHFDFDEAEIRTEIMAIDPEKGKRVIGNEHRQSAYVQI